MSRFALACLVLVRPVATASAQVQTLADVSFAVPPGWQYARPANDGPATVELGSGDSTSVIAVFKPLSSSGNAEADFTAAWAQVVRSMPPPAPIYDYASVAGYSGREGSVYTDDGSHYVHLYVLEAGSSAIPVLVVTVDRRTFDDLRRPISLFVDGVRRAPLRAEPVRTTITIPDLVGDWQSGGESSVSYVTSSGAYAGSSTVAHAATYLIASDGSFTAHFGGLSNRQIVRGKGGGQVELGEGLLTFREPAQDRVTRYHIISYQTALSGATILTLLAESYEPTGANIGWYAEKWIRERS